MTFEENCQICLQPITNPICSECYIKHVDNWLVSQGMGPVERNIVISRIRRALPRESLNPHLCVSCLDGYLSLCSYCFFFKTLNILRELGFSDRFLESFEEIFSYLQEDAEVAA